MNADSCINHLLGADWLILGSTVMTCLCSLGVCAKFLILITEPSAAGNQRGLKA